MRSLRVSGHGLARDVPGGARAPAKLPGPFPLFASLLALLVVLLSASCRVEPPEALPPPLDGIVYTNQQVMEKPWSIHLVRLDRARHDLEFLSTRGRGAFAQMRTLTEQIDALPPGMGTVVAGLNGDYFQMFGRPYAGDPRGLHISQGDLLSVPNGGPVFWLDASGQPRTTYVSSLCAVRWPDGRALPIGLDEIRKTNSAVLYTPAVGVSTRTTNGLELLLEPSDDGAWLPLRLGQKVKARVRGIWRGGDAPISPDGMVLSVEPRLALTLPRLPAGALLEFCFDTLPDLRRVETAVGGGPILVRRGEKQRWMKRAPLFGDPLPYEFRSMSERHPRSALGWNSRYFYLVEVDGRQKHLSVGMTLDELADYMMELGCTEVMNLDGGGSSSIWFGGCVANSPSDRREREIGNALIVVRKEKSAAAPRSDL